MTIQPFLPFSVAMITPFSQEDEVDANAIHRLVRYYAEHEVPALLVCGSTGQQHSLTVDERILLYRTVKDAAPEHMPLYAGVAAIRTRDAIRLAEQAQLAGYAGIMLGFPPYVRPSQREAALYAEAVCSATSLPIMLYNNPVRTGFNLETDTLFQLVNQFPQINALKETGSPEHVRRVKTRLGSSFQVLSGYDLTIAEYSAMGYDGLTSVAGNLFPREMMRITELLRAGNTEHANRELAQIHTSLETLGAIGWIRVIQHVFAKQGMTSGHVRDPLTPLTAEEQAVLTQIIPIP
ncbi:dihydrodipicolinate synthase family protein [Paenibacillus sp. LHD-117]|uniref:dihydrodipicolinate synthase family protein n=1 Tax=Paenibacillus sp. LHD-117 TaxID=3071412 RepID=UPI0027E05AB1|nr:dihydrodipicolinate synthase family protein [Paenibacillus sp. LHD-117]MDQ6423546.1 dihydrodipicolinate synthase family protein [Paenibacillus sp. LHD-117]